MQALPLLALNLAEMLVDLQLPVLPITLPRKQTLLLHNRIDNRPSCHSLHSALLDWFTYCILSMPINEPCLKLRDQGRSVMTGGTLRRFRTVSHHQCAESYAPRIQMRYISCPYNIASPFHDCHHSSSVLFPFQRQTRVDSVTLLASSP